LLKKNHDYSKRGVRGERGKPEGAAAMVA